MLMGETQRSAVGITARGRMVRDEKGTYAKVFSAGMTPGEDAGNVVRERVRDGETERQDATTHGENLGLKAGTGAREQEAGRARRGITA